MPDVSFFDPKQEAEVKRKRLMAQMMIQQGQQPDRTEVVSGVAVKQSPLAAMARAIQQGVGGYQAGSADRMEAADAEKRQKFLVEAMTGLKTDPQAAATMLMGNPSTADLGTKLYLGQLDADAKSGQLAEQYAREDSNWARDAAFKRELLAAKGGQGGYTSDPVTGEIVFDPTAVSDAPRKLSPTETKEMFEAQEKIDAGEGALGALTQAQNIYSRGQTDPATGKEIPGAAPYTGWGAEARSAMARTPLIGDFIADKERGAATTEASNLVTQQALDSLKTSFGGNPTEGERAILLKLQALPTYTPEEQKVILTNAIAAANRRKENEAQKLKSIETGNYFGQQQVPVAPQAMGGVLPAGGNRPFNPDLGGGMIPADIGNGNINDPVPGLPPVGDNAAQIRNTPVMQVPQVGTIMDNHRFKGGNPADPNSWEPLQ